MKTTSLELSKKLKAAGAKQESGRKWRHTGNKFTLAKNATRWPICACSFDCHELLERLSGIDEPELVYDSNAYDGGQWEARLFSVDGSTAEARAPAEALGKLYLWCLENRHITHEDLTYKGCPINWSS